jgi:hypothetical protein
LACGHLRWIYFILGFVTCGLVLLTLSRLAFTLWQLAWVAAVDGFWWVLLAPLVVIPVRLMPCELGRYFANKAVAHPTVPVQAYRNTAYRLI